MPPPQITVLGSLNIDLVSYVPHHPLPGETLTSNHFSTSAGGKGANQAVACAKLSRPSPSTASSSSSQPAGAASTHRADDATAIVSMIGAVGADSHGQTLLSSLTANGVDTSGVIIRGGGGGGDDGKTGIAIIIVDEPTGQNRIILSPESNHSLLPDQVSHIPGPLVPHKPDLLIMQLEIPLPTVLQALQAAKHAGVPVLLNPAPAQKLPDEAYRGLAHLVVNETEAAVLSGSTEAELEEETGLRRVADSFLEKGVENVIVTLGGRGVYYATMDGQHALVAAAKVDVVDTTAAGDTFVGSYALAVVTAAAAGVQLSMATAIKNANAAAAITVSRKGAQVSIPWRDELQ